MIAALCERYGAPEVVQLREVPTPVPKPREVLIRIEAASVSSGDCRVRGLAVPSGFGLLMRLSMGFSKPRQPILGTELAGVVEATGVAVTKFKAGDRVCAFTDTAMGCHAEYTSISENGAIIPRPGMLSREAAAALSFGGTAALHYLRKAGVRAGEQLLVNGASGSVGMAAVQLARHFGAEVTAVCSGANAELLRSLGAGRVVDYTKEDFTQHDEKYDIIFDTVCSLPFSRVTAALKKGGRLLQLAAGLLDMLAIPWRQLTSGIKIIAGPAGGSVEDLRFLAELAEAGEYTPIVDRCYPLQQIVDAHRYVDGGHKKGNVVITMTNVD
jgi:NADPH:quinone reductase-like Zn-dependent oxidoreductase